MPLTLLRMRPKLWPQAGGSRSWGHHPPQLQPLSLCGLPKGTTRKQLTLCSSDRGGETSRVPDLVPSPPAWVCCSLPLISLCFFPSFSTFFLFSHPISGFPLFSLIETFTELRVLLKHVDLCPYSGCEHRMVCATRVDDISCDRRAGLCWVDQRGIWYKTYVFIVCLWGAGYVYTACVLLLLVYDVSLGVSVVCGGLSPGCVSLSVLWVHCVCLRAYHVSLCYLPFVHCTWLNLPGGDVFTCVCVCVLSLLLLSWVRGPCGMYLCATGCVHVVLHPV